MIEGKTREEEIAIRMERFSISRAEAEFITAIERGEIDGDIKIVAPDGSVKEAPLGRGMFD